MVEDESKKTKLDYINDISMQTQVDNLLLTKLSNTLENLNKNHEKNNKQLELQNANLEKLNTIFFFQN